MTKAQAWLLAARPKTLPAALAPVVLSQSMAYANGAFSLSVAGGVLACWPFVAATICNAGHYRWRSGWPASERWIFCADARR